MELRKRKSSTSQNPNKPKKLVKNVSSNQTNFKIEDYLIDKEWENLLKEEFEKEYFKKINVVLSLGYEKNIIRPPKDFVFNALNSTKLDDIKCVILGQDPYHDDEQVFLNIIIEY